MEQFDGYIRAAMWAGDKDGSLSVICRNTSTPQVTFWHPRDRVMAEKSVN